MNETPSTQSPTEDLSKLAAAALVHVESGMDLGLGTGKAAEAFITALAERVRGGLRVRGVPTSTRSADLAKRLGIDLVALDEVERLHVAFDGADEVAPSLDLVKGLGGALVRERVVANEAQRFIVLVTGEKLVPRLGSRAPIPVEVVPFAAASVARHLTGLGCTPTLRTKADGGSYRTDNQNSVLDARFAHLDDPRAIEASIRRIPGVVDTGLFLGMAHLILVLEGGAVRELRTVG